MVEGEKVLMGASPCCCLVVGHAAPVDGGRVVAEDGADALNEAVEFLMRLPGAQAEHTIGPDVRVDYGRQHGGKRRLCGICCGALQLDVMLIGEDRTTGSQRGEAAATEDEDVGFGRIAYRRLQNDSSFRRCGKALDCGEITQEASVANGVYGSASFENGIDLQLGTVANTG
jgi:hypothetical protein